jgi:hypothetical protein
LRDRLAADTDLSASWSLRLNADCTDPELLAALILKHSTSMNPGGCVLFSSTSAQRIKRNAAVFGDRNANVSALPDLIADSNRVPAN